MGYTIEASREAAVEASTIFGLYTDPSTWSVWGHNVRWARADGPLVEGGTVEVRPAYPVTYHCLVERLVQDRLLRLEVRPFGLQIINVYQVDPTSRGCRIRHALEMSGPLSAPIRWLGGARAYRRSLEDEIRHCIELASVPR
jgi:polyketide cyclase/dehydrase/lipid transport protein